jgi:hypothetical protein
MHDAAAGAWSPDAADEQPVGPVAPEVGRHLERIPGPFRSGRMSAISSGGSGGVARLK